MSDVQLLLNGDIYSGWTSVKIRRSLDLFADTFDLTLTDNQANQARTIKLGSPCRVRIDGETIITGYVDRIRPSHDGKSRSLEVSGRSKTADLVDCSLPVDSFGKLQQKNQTLLQLAKFIAEHFGISATSEVDLPTITIADISPGQTAHEFLEGHTQQAAVMMVSAQDGNLVLTRAGNQRLSTALILGENIESAEGEFSHRERFSHYYFPAQTFGTDYMSGEDASHLLGKAGDTTMRVRPFVLQVDATSQQDSQVRAKWEANVRYGRSRQATYTVNGWRHQDGLWERNTNVLVRDEWLGFTGKDGQGEWLMIGTVEYVLDNRGERTRLTVMPREAYDLIPLPSDDGGNW